METRNRTGRTELREVRRSIDRLQSSFEAVKVKGDAWFREDEFSGLYSLPATLCGIARSASDAELRRVLTVAIGEAAEIEYRIR